MKKLEIIEKMTHKSQASGSSGHNDGNLVILMNMTVEIMEVIYYHISFYIVFL